jgi:hypothetical protein
LREQTRAYLPAIDALFARHAADFAGSDLPATWAELRRSRIVTHLE